MIHRKEQVGDRMETTPIISIERQSTGAATNFSHQKQMLFEYLARQHFSQRIAKCQQ
jgi:hypothetical protein